MSNANATPPDDLAFFRGEKILVTGAGGFIGSHLCEMLVAAGARVRALIRYSSHRSVGNLAFLAPETLDAIEIVAGNVEDIEALHRQVAGCAVVFHLAALIGIPYSYHAPRSYLATNIAGTLNALEAARQHHVRRFVLCSTSEVYGSAKTIPIAEDHPLQGQSPYSASKIAAEKLAESFHKSFALPLVTVRPFNTFGPRQTMRAIIPSVIMQALHGSEIQAGNLSTTRDLTYITDTCAGLLRAGGVSGIDGLVCNLGLGTSVAMGDLAKIILNRMGVDKPIQSVPERMRPNESEVQNLQSDNRLARERLGWQPQLGLAEGLDRTIEFYRRQPKPARVADYVV
jgi:dTDP-glucose 4,6-dehydratase